MDWFYYDENGKKVGPFKVAQIRELVAIRIIKRDTKIENANGRQAFAGTMQGLDFPPDPIPKPVPPALVISEIVPTVPKATVPVPPKQQLDDIFAIATEIATYDSVPKPQLTSIVFCRHCSKEIPQESRFCPSCGESNEQPSHAFCRHCGKELASDSRFCPSCGGERTGATPVPAWSQASQQVDSPNPIPQNSYSGPNKIKEVVVFEGQPDGFGGVIGQWVAFVLVILVLICICLSIPSDKIEAVIPVLAVMFLPLIIGIPLYVLVAVSSTKLTITNKKSILFHGIFTRTEVELLHTDIKSIVISQGLIQRLFNVGTVYIATSATSLAAGIVASRFSNPDAIKRIIQRYQNKSS